MASFLRPVLFEPVQALARRRLLALSIGLFVVWTAVVYALPPLQPLRAPFAEGYATPILRALVLVALAPGIGRLRSPAERRFWSLLVAAFATWFLSDLVFLAPEGGSFFWSVLEGLGYFVFWPIFLVGMGQAPERNLRVLDWRGTRWVPTAATILTGLAVCGYVVGIPIAVDREAFLGSIPSYEAFVLLDLIVGCLLTARAVRSRGRWRRIYAMLAVALGIWTVTDFLGGLWVAGVLDMPYGLHWDLLWFAPYLVVVFTAAVRDATAGTGDPGPVLEEGARSTDVGYALGMAGVVPVLHALTALLAPLPVYEPWQGQVALGSVAAHLALAGLAILLARRHRRDQVHVVVLDDAFQETQKMEALGRLSGGVAHDFNNLLLLVQGHIELMAETLEGLPEGREFVDSMRRAVERGTGLTRQLLAFGRQPGGTLHATDANSLIEETRSLLERSLGEDIQLRTELADDLWHVGIEPGQMSQILINLALNARNAMPAGGRLTVRTRNLKVETVEPPGPPSSLVEIEVSDTGVGMDEETRRRIFEPFFTTRQGNGGTGLGLSVVYGIVRQHGGEIRCHSASGLGSTFRILLPRVAAVAVTPVPDAGFQALPGRQGTVLLAEDQADVRALTVRCLERLGYEVVVAADGVEAWELAEGRDPVTVVLTDVVMPGLGGVDLARRLRTIWPHVPVVFVSGYAQDPQAADELRELGSAILQKPYTLAALAEALDQAKRDAAAAEAEGA